MNSYSKQFELMLFYACVIGIPSLAFVFFRSRISEKVREPVGSKEKKPWLLWSLFLYLVVPAFLYVFLLPKGIDGFLDLYHDGERLAPLQMFSDGALPYVEIYLQHGLIRNLLLPFLATKVAGMSLEGIRSVYLYLSPIPYLFFYLLCLRVFRNSILYSVLLTSIVSAHFYWVGLREGIMLSVLLCVLLWLKTRNAVVLFVAGALSAFAFWFSLDFGLYSITSCLICLALIRLLSAEPRVRRKDVVSYLFGLWAFSFPVLLWIASFGGLKAFAKNLLVQIRYQTIVWGLPFPRLMDGSAQASIIYASVLALLLCGMFVSKRLAQNNKTIFDIELLVIFVFSVICFRTALGRSDYGHWIDGSTLIWVLLFAVFRRLLISGRYQKVLALFGIVAISAYFLHAHQVSDVSAKRIKRFGLARPFRQAKPVISRVGRVELPEEQTRAIRSVVSYLQKNTAEDDYIYDYANQAAYYFLANRKSPTRYFQLSYAVTIAMQEEIVRELESKEPKFVISSTGTVFDAIDGIPSSKRQPIVSAYIEQHYEFAEKFVETRVLKRKE